MMTVKERVYSYLVTMIITILILLCYYLNLN